MKLTPKEIIELFVHRKDVFARQTPEGFYIPVRRLITEEDIQKHLDGESTYGIYCLDVDNTVKWACIDIDGEPEELIANKKEAEFIYSLFPDFKRMLEFSGRKGYHIWIFFKKPTNAGFAQRLILARLHRFGIGGHEIFPKQTELNEARKYGNLVKVPLALHQVSKKRSIILQFEEAK